MESKQEHVDELTEKEKPNPTRDEFIKEYLLEGEFVEDKINLENMEFHEIYDDYHTFKNIFNNKLKEGGTHLEQRRIRNKDVNLSDYRKDCLFEEFEEAWYKLERYISAYKKLIYVDRINKKCGGVSLSIIDKIIIISYQIEDICSELNCESKLLELFGTMLMCRNRFGVNIRDIDIIMGRWRTIIKEAAK